MLRLAATLAVLVGLAGLLGFLHVLGSLPTSPAPLRHLRAMKDRRAPPASVEPLDLDAIARLPRKLPLAEYAAIERRGVSIEGYVQRMLRAADGDVHLEVAPRARDARLPDTLYVTAEITPQWREGRSGWSFGALARALRPSHDGSPAPWPDGPRRARFTGWLLYDYQYDVAPGEMVGNLRVNGWEIHPVTRLELWDDARQAFVELPR